MDIQDVMTVSEVASILKVGKNAVYDAIRCGRLKAIKIGKSLRVTRPALLATMVKAPKEREIPALFSDSYQSYNGREPD